MVVQTLHGLPVSIKDSFFVEGIQSTVGYVSFLENEPATPNLALVEMLLNLGTLLYVKINILQTDGDSSGGEGALVAFRGSIPGIGIDIAGSIRIPSLCCAVYGFRPTTDRIPWGGQVADLAMEGVPGLKPSPPYTLLLNLLDYPARIISSLVESPPGSSTPNPWLLRTAFSRAMIRTSTELMRHLSHHVPSRMKSVSGPPAL